MTFCNLNAPSRFFKVPPKNTPKTHLKRGHTKKCQKQKLSSEYFGGSCSLESSTSCGSKSGILFLLWCDGGGGGEGKEENFS